jgi:hypothetical protein
VIEMDINRLLVCAGLVGVVYSWSTGESRADMIVLESSAPKYKKGMSLPDGEIMDLASGERVKVLIIPSNVTKEFSGRKDNRAPGGTRGERDR